MKLRRLLPSSWRMQMQKSHRYLQVAFAVPEKIRPSDKLYLWQPVTPKQ